MQNLQTPAGSEKNGLPDVTSTGITALHVDWAKDAGNRWHNLNFVDLSRLRGYGVYIIWTSSVGPVPSSVVRVGRGDIASGLQRERDDPRVGRFGPGVFVTWATVDPLYASGAEVYLIHTLKPSVGKYFPLSPAIEVNLPMIA